MAGTRYVPSMMAARRWAKRLKAAIDINDKDQTPSVMLFVVAGENQSRRDLMKVAQYEVLGSPFLKSDPVMEGPIDHRLGWRWCLSQKTRF